MTKEPHALGLQGRLPKQECDSLFNNGVVSIKSCSHAETYRIVKTYILTLQR